MENTTFWFMFQKGDPDVMAIFNWKKEVIAGGAVSAAFASHILNSPSGKAKDEIFFVASQTRKLPTSCNDKHVLSLQGFIDLPVIGPTKAKKRLSDEAKGKIIELRDRGFPIRQVAMMCDVSPSTVQRVLIKLFKHPEDTPKTPFQALYLQGFQSKSVHLPIP